MSAPEAGRQSPEPDQQSDRQQQAHPAQQDGGSGKLDNSKAKNEGKDDQLGGLESNPKHILEDEANKKTSKTE